MVKEKATFDERLTEVAAELHAQMNSSLKCMWKRQRCTEDYVQLLQGLKRARAEAEYMWRWCQDGSYGVSVIVSSVFSAPWLGFLFQVFLSSLITLMSSTCPFSPVPRYLLLLIHFLYLCQTSSISGCFAWFLGWLWAGLDTSESCVPTVSRIKLLKHSPTGFPAFWILSIVNPDKWTV